MGTEHALKTQRNLWIHIIIAMVVMSVAFCLKLSRVEFGLLLLAIFGVIVTEMLNTAIEEMVNLLSPQQKAEAGLVKNIAAGAVLLASICAVIIGLVVFVARFI
jgi:diacylglycerol kinase